MAGLTQHEEQQLRNAIVRVFEHLTDDELARVDLAWLRMGAGEFAWHVHDSALDVAKARARRVAQS